METVGGSAVALSSRRTPSSQCSLSSRFAGALAAALLMAWLDGHLTGPEVAASVAFTLYLAARVSLIGVAATSRAAAGHLRPPRPLDGVDQTDGSAGSATPVPPTISTTRLGHRASRASEVAAGRRARAAVEAIGVVELWAVIAAVGGGHSLLLALVAYVVSSMFAIVVCFPVVSASSSSHWARC